MATYIKQYTTPYIGVFVDDLDELGDIEKAVVAISDRTGAVHAFDGEIDESGLVSVHLTEEQSGAIADGLCSLEVSFLIEGDIVEKTETGTTSTTTSSSSTNIKITDTSTIGFTPKAFIMWLDGSPSTSRYMVNDSMFLTQGSSYIRHTKYRGSSSDSYLNATTNWTSQTSGYLYFNSNTVYFRNTSSYRLATGTYRWIALTW